jgi:hypothetical protein
MKMIVALILIVTSIAEGWETLMSDLELPRFGGHYSV